MKEKLMLLFVSVFFSVTAVVAQKTVTGTVAEEDGTPLIGVSVAVKGGAPVAVTDFDGNYSAQVADGAVLVFSYLGMQNKEVAVTGAVHNVVLAPESATITELVVTAMGISQEKKKMNFAVQALGADDLTANKSTNFVESLRGKVSGVNLTQQGGSPNSASQMIIRGISSIDPSMTNEPMFVIDGMQMSGGASSMAALNPNDIENVTVLKGAAASALYGSDAANGVVMITTKSGTKGKLTVNASASYQVDQAARVPEIQSMFQPGARGVLKNREWMNGWGPYVQDQEVYDNVGNYFRTGQLQKYDASVSGGSEKFTSYASVSYMKHDGIIIDDYSNRVGLMFKGSYDVSPTVNVSFMANVSNAESRDATGGMANIYSWPITMDMRDYENPDGTVKWLYEQDPSTPQSITENVLSPYWKRYNDDKKTESTRNLLQASASWKPIKGLTLSGKLGYDSSNSATNDIEVPRYKRKNLTQDEENAIASTLSLLGKYGVSTSRSSLYTTNVMATYGAELNEDWSINAMVGAEAKISKGFSTKMEGLEFDDTGTISFNTTKYRDPALSTVNRREQTKNGFFGELRFDYRGLLQFSGTLRNDQTSTLIQSGNESYFYPSVTGGLIFSELFDIRSDFFDYGKIRGNWAKVGKDPNPYLFGQKYIQKPTLPDGGIGLNPTLSIASEDLGPEMSKSWEVGADLRFFKGKTTLDIAYYSVAIDRQIVTVRVSPAAGKILMTRNEGDIENYGMEMTLGQEFYSNKDFTWNGTVNFSFNRGRVRYLPDNLQEAPSIQVSDAFGVAILHGPTTAVRGKDYMRTADGKIICDENGMPKMHPDKGAGQWNREPDFIAGFANNLKYKDWRLSFLVDFRKGGDVVNQTARSLWGNGQHQRHETYRNREIIIDGVVEQADGTYIANTKPIVFDQLFVTDHFVTPVSNFVEDGSYVRLSYVTLSYDLAKLVKNTAIKGLNVSLTGRNLLLLTRYSGSDPDVNQGSTGGAGSAGFDNLNVPKTRSWNLSLTATF